MVSHSSWIYLVVFYKMLFDKCESIFALLILVDSSKDANHAGNTFLPVSTWTPFVTSFWAAK